MQETIIEAEVNEAPKPKRRSYTREFKRQLVALCEEADRSIASVALEHQINANLLHKWSRELKGGSAPSRMVPVSVRPEAPPACSRIEVLVGEVTVRFYGTVDHHNAKAVLSTLR